MKEQELIKTLGLEIFYNLKDVHQMVNINHYFVMTVRSF